MSSRTWASLQQLAEYGTVVTLISRPGVHAVTEGDRRWASALMPLAPAFAVQLATADVHGRCTVRPIL